ncbi:MAG TPA: hypothetical protein ENK23_00545 [Sorangium sp.]|nr:hypothetical protein [Sorangium sp.]
MADDEQTRAANTPTADAAQQVTAQPPGSALDSGRFTVPRRRIWPALLLLALTALGAAGALWWHLDKAAPTRVLIAVDIEGQWWEGSEPAAQFADALAQQLEQLGFDVVRAGAPETLAALQQGATPQAAAKALHAAFVITGSASPDLVALPVAGGFTEARLRGELRLQHLADERPTLVLPLHGYVGASRRDAALTLAVTQLVRLAVSATAPALINHPTIDALMHGNNARVIDQLTPAKQFASAQSREMARAKAAYVDLDQQRRAADKGGREWHFISPIDAEDRLVATGAAGVLLSTAPTTPYYEPTDGRLLRYHHLETIEWRNDAGDRTLLWEGYNLFGYPSAARAGTPVVLVEDLFGWARSLALISTAAPASDAPAPNKPRRQRPLSRLKVKPVRKLSTPRLSPDGRWIAYTDKACVRCVREVTVIDALAPDHPEQVRLQAPAYTSIGDYRWLNNKQLMMVARIHDEDGTRSAGEGYGLWALDVANGRRSSLLLGHGAQLATPVATTDGTTVAIAHVNGNAVVVLDVENNHVRRHAVGGRPSSLAFSPDGRWLVFELLDKRHRDIAALNVATGKLVRLTDNDAPDRFPQFSANGKRVYFEARNTDPLFGRKRAVVRIVWVAFDDE